MPSFNFHYTPENLAVGDAGTWISSTDGDTPTIQLPIRMLGIDSPEVHFGGATENNPGKFDEAMQGFLSKEGKNLPSGLKKYLRKRLLSKPSTRQIQAGRKALDHFQEVVKQRLDRGLGKDGKPLNPRKLFLMASNDVFDMNGRMLAYVAPSYTKAERESIAPGNRPTFNLQMVQDGWAASLIIYPNIPKPADLTLVQKAVKNARTHHKGMWADKSKTLLPYEFRWIVKMIQGQAMEKALSRYCADITTAKLYKPEDYYRVLPENRVFFFKEHAGKALEMGLEMQ